MSKSNHQSLRNLKNTTNKKKKRERAREKKKTMARGSSFFIIFSIISLLAYTINSLKLDRHSFPESFIFGTAASAFQVPFFYD